MRISRWVKAAIYCAIITVFLTISVYADNVGVVTGLRVNMRSKPTTDSNIVTVLPKGTNVVITGETGDWYCVQYNSYKGYMHKDYVKPATCASSSVGSSQQAKPVSTNPASTASTTSTAVTGVVTGATVNLREQPSTSSKILTSLKKNTKVTIIGESGSFYKVTYGNYTGYMHKDYVSKSAAQTSDKPADLGDGVVTASVLNIRSKPSTSSSIVKVLKKGTVVLVLSKEGDWYKIQHSGQVGYAYAEYIDLARGSETSRGQISSKAAQIIEFAKKFLGVKYVYGGASPNGFDCSGFTYYVFKNYGINIPHGATSQSKLGTAVSRSELLPGDLVFFSSPAFSTPIGHVGIYLGDGKFIHASSPGDVVKISTMTSGYYYEHYVCARRLIR